MKDGCWTSRGNVLGVSLIPLLENALQLALISGCHLKCHNLLTVCRAQPEYGSHARILRKEGFSVSYQRPDKPTSSSCKKKKKEKKIKGSESKLIRTFYLNSVLLFDFPEQAQVDSNLFLCRTVRVSNLNKDFWQFLGEICRPNKVKRAQCKGSAFNPSRKRSGTASACYLCSFWGVFLGPCKYSKGIGSGLFWKGRVPAQKQMESRCKTPGKYGKRRTRQVQRRHSRHLFGLNSSFFLPNF